MNSIVAAVFAVALVSPSVTALATGEYAAALRCHDDFASTLGEDKAATLCRGVVNANVTAVNNCVSEGNARKFAAAVTAELCQGISYAITTATLNCFDQAIEDRELTPTDAAQLCQRTSYAAYTAKFNCLSYALDTMLPAAAAKLCGGIAP